MTAVAESVELSETYRRILQQLGNPFRNYFARHPDDEVCARYHVPELFAAERELLHAIIDMYRCQPQTHSEVVPILGSKGAGKTHLLHSIKHGGGPWQLLVTPGVYQRDSEFLEYLLFQIIDTLLGGGQQKGIRPLHYVGEQLVRRELAAALREPSDAELGSLFPAGGLGRWGRRFGWGLNALRQRAAHLADALAGTAGWQAIPLASLLHEAGVAPEGAFALLAARLEHGEQRNAAGLMRRHIAAGLAKAVLLRDETELANFLTYGFAELEFHVRPTRQDLVLALFKVLMDLLRSLHVPVVVAFDQLEDLLLVRRGDDAYRTAETFFAGIVQVLHQIDGLCFLVFAERGLWNRFVPSLDGYIQDRLNNPVHVSGYGTVQAVRLEAPPPELFRKVVEARLRPCLAELPAAPSPIFPFTAEQLLRIARTEPTLRDMLQQCRYLYDHLIYGDEADLPLPLPDQCGAATLPAPGEPDAAAATTDPVPCAAQGEPDPAAHPLHAVATSQDGVVTPQDPVATSQDGVVTPQDPVAASEELPPSRLPADVMAEPSSRLPRLSPSVPPDPESVTFRHVSVIEVPENGPAGVPPAPAAADAAEAATPASRPALFAPPAPIAPLAGPDGFPPPGSGAAWPSPRSSERCSRLTLEQLGELWDQEQRSARRKLEPEGALTGASRELQAGLGAFLQVCHEHGVKVGPWRLLHVVPEWTFGDHPTYGVVTLAHWACKDGPPWRVGIGLFLARGAGKPRELEIKLAAMDIEPVMVDHLILLRPEDDLSLTGKSKQLWAESERRGKHARLEAVSLDGFAQLYAFPRWLAAVREALPQGAPLPNLADLIQDRCERLLRQVCMPVHG